VIEIVAFDADDTLWHNEPLYSATTNRFRELLASYHSPAWIEQRLYETEIRNLRHYGYGIKSFTLSMIETAVELTEGRIKGSEISEIVAYGKEMLAAPVRLLEGARETVSQLMQSYKLIIVTKGDLLDQESKIARSGLGECFFNIEVVSEKNRTTYERICRENRVEPSQLVVVGDSLRSDVLPAVEAGCHAIHVPYDTPWQHEVVADEQVTGHEFLCASGLGAVPHLIAGLYPDPDSPG
jgi:putative hydrolase of the HAD superfamily